MKNKKVVILISFIFLIGGIFLVNNIYQNNKIDKTKRKKQSNLAIMIKEDGATDYTKSSSKNIPIGNYELNYEKSYCKNNGVIGDYDSALGKVSFSFIGTDSCYLYFDYNAKPGYFIILNNNGGKDTIEAKGTPDFSKIATTNDGMYAAQDDLGTSYYFRGAVNNNWVKFGKDSNSNDMYWRIIRINGDGSIRMIYSGTTAPTSSTAAVMTGTGTQIGTSTFNSSYDNPAYVGYMYIAGEQHEGSYESAIKIVIDDWYKSTTLETDKTFSRIIVDQIFCNDRTASMSTSGTYGEIGSMSTGATYYFGAYKRIVADKNPSLICPAENDKFTENTSNIGNKLLKYPVGLITVDEVVMAGGAYGISNNEYYLYTNQHSWSLSPIHFYSSSTADEFCINSSGSIDNDFVSIIGGIRPVINLSKNIKLSGNGTWNNVYTVIE